MNDNRQDVINIKAVYNKLASNYLLFILNILIGVGLAYMAFKLLPPKFEIATTVQLKDQGLTNKGTAKEKFIVGMELMEGDGELEDEMGILSSYSMVRRALLNTDLSVSYFTYSTKLGPLSKRMEEEFYQEKFFVILQTKRPQIIDEPIYIEFVSPTEFIASVDADDATLYELSSQKALKKKINASKTVSGTVGHWVTTPFFAFQLSTEDDFKFSPSEKYYITIQNLESLTKEYSNKITIAPISKESNIVKVGLLGRVPKKEINFLNSLSNAYIENDVAKKQQLGLQTLAFIDAQLALIHDSLSVAEKNLKTFRTSNNIIDISTTAQNLYNQMQDLEKELAELNVQHDFYNYTRSYLHQSDEPLDIVAPSSIGINDPFLNNLLIQLSELYREKIEKSYSSKPNSPVSQLIESKITNTKKAILDNIEGLVEVNAIGLQENDTRMRSLQTLIRKLPESEKNLININRKFSLNDNIYNYLLEKRAEAGIALASNYPDKSVIDPARQLTKKPVSPNLLLFLLAGAFAGICLSIFSIIGSSFFSNKIKDQKEIESLTDIRVVGMINIFNKGNSKLLLDEKIGIGPSSEAFKFLTINLRQLFSFPACTVIGVTSAQQGDGKTFCSLNIAAMFAQSGKRTLYMDADLLKNSTTKKALDKANDKSDLGNFLAYDIDERALVRPSSIKNLFILPAGQLDLANRALMYEQESKLDTLFKSLADTFDIIVVDTPPIATIADYFLLSKYFNINLVVVRYNNTDKALLEEALPMMQLRSLKNLGLVINGIKLSKIKSHQLNAYYKIKV